MHEHHDHDMHQITLFPCKYRPSVVGIYTLTAGEHICKFNKIEKEGFISSRSLMIEHIMHFHLCYASASQVATKSTEVPMTPSVSPDM